MAAERGRPASNDPTRVIPVGEGGPAGTRRQGVAGGRVPDAPPGAGVRPPSPGRPAGPHRPADPHQPAGPAGPGAPAGPAPATPSGRRRRRVPARRIALLVVLLLVAYPVALVVVAWTHLGRVEALPSGTASTPGRTYLVVGTDSRKGMTAAERKTLHTGRAAGQRTDTILLLHVPAGDGPTVLMSVPRDSYVQIPGHRRSKINTAFAIGGPKLLASTLEQATGVQIDDYVEIGFAGFAGMVDAVDGVQVCPTRAMKDRRAGIDLAKGCQQADGPTALGYARARYSDPRGDLGRVERQREVLAAIVAKATRPSTLANPFRTFPLASSGAGALVVDEHTGPAALAQFVLGMKATAGTDGVSLTVPVSGTANRPGAGSVVLWDERRAKEVFTALRLSSTEPVREIAAEQKRRLAAR